MDEAVKFLASKIGYTIAVILGFIIPGIMFIFVWKRELFLELDIIKLIILGFGIAFILYIPIFILNMCFFIIKEKITDKEWNLLAILLVPATLNVLIMMLVMVIKIVNNAYSIIDFIKEFEIPIVVGIFFMGILTFLPNCIWNFFKKVISFIKKIFKL